MWDIGDLEGALRRRLAGTLPGADAHQRFAPVPQRPGWKAGYLPADARLAAGLVLLYPKPREIVIPLTVRASGLRRHAGQISLPGGAIDPGETAADAALRETHEELGIETTGLRVVGELTPIHVLVSGFTLHPIVAVADRAPAFVPAAHEVEEVIEVTLDHLRDASRIRRGTRLREGVAVEYPYFDLRGHQVWGATAMVLGEFVTLLQGE
ncbi:MAG TPA: CoA pyrophosphatase [Vicinamibacterales bacterium]|jgi:8-oxo-dGTP pyrophosphatase MutT (NUDIX family)